MLYTFNDSSIQEGQVEEPRKILQSEATLTLVVPPGRVNSFKHKVDRIRRQTEFEKEKRDQFESLTKREIEIVSLLAIGHDNPCIAESLFISRNTVEQHRKNIRRKLEVQSLVHLMEYALAFDLV